MAAAFQMLRSYDLLWSRVIGQYLMGAPARNSDLMEWNADATRMPARMHSQYLRRLFLDDDLSEGRYPVDGKPVSLSDIGAPVFLVGTVRTTWRPGLGLQAALSALRKSPSCLPAAATMPASSARQGIRAASSRCAPAAGGAYCPPDQWAAETPVTEGSWWPAWQAWLAQHSGAHHPPRLGGAKAGHLDDAPGPTSWRNRMRIVHPATQPTPLTPLPRQPAGQARQRRPARPDPQPGLRGNRHR
jgi:polyhydroxyalkanoate synthase